jgi:large subunit ribosomal protein L17
MRHHKHGRILSRRVDHRKALIANLASSLVLHGRIKTTDAKAKEVRPFIERMVTFARRGDLHARRIVLSRLRDAEAVHKLFADIGPKFVGRNGGYTRILKLGYRHGDAAPVSLIEFVGLEEEKKAVKRKRTRTRTSSGAPAETAAPAEETAEVKAESTEHASAETGTKPARKSRKEKKPTGEQTAE